VSFDSKTNTIRFKDDGDILSGSGSFFLKLLRDVGGASNAPKGVAADWTTVATWLGCEERELTQDDYQKFGLVFRSYVARGVAPSVALEESFNEFARMARSEAWPVIPVPQELVPVLKRLIANDHDIQQKRANDALEFATALKSLNSPPSRSAAPVQAPESAYPIVRLNWIPLVASITMLLMALADSWPYGFYQLLRIVVAGTAAYIVVQTANRRQCWPWIMGGLALLFNPILPISFTRKDWQPIDFGVAVIFLIALIQELRRRL